MRHCLFLPRALKRRKNSALKKIADYEYEVLGGTHVTLATKHLHEKFLTVEELQGFILD